MTTAERIATRGRTEQPAEYETARPDWSHIEKQLQAMAECSDPEECRRRRHMIVTECLPLADHIAHRFFGRGEPSEDLIQVARMGLVKSVDRYVPGRGPFTAFAVPTIRGEVRRYFRDSTWTMRVPRRVQETQLRMRRTVDDLSQRLSRAPTDVEVARELGVDDDEVAQCHSAHSAYRPVSLDARRGEGGDGGTSIAESCGANDPRFDSVEDLLVLGEVISELDPRRRAILNMRFFDCLTQREIAARLNISQVQVSRLLSGTLTRLRQRICTDVPVVLCVVAPLAGAGIW